MPRARVWTRQGTATLLEISYDVRIGRDSVPQRHAMPAIPGAVEHAPSLPERVGKALRDRFGMVALTAAVGGVAGALALGRSPLTRIAGGIAGALAGGALATAAATVAGPTQRLSQGGKAPAPVDVAADEPVRVMTFNLRGGFGPHRLGPGNAIPARDRYLDAIVEQIRREQPDIVLLQELDNRHVRSYLRDQLAYLERELGPDGAVAAYPREDLASLGVRVGGQGVLTFNGFTIDNARELASPNEPKYGLLDTLVRTPEGTIVRAMSVHMHGAAMQQLGEYAAAVDAWRGATILGGDFNRNSASPAGQREAQLLAGVGLRDSFVDAGVPPGDARRVSFRSGTDIDRVNVTDHFEVDDVRVVREDGLVSDHLAIVADLRLARSPR